MASEALLVIRARLAIDGLVRVMAGGAGEARVAIAPAAGVFEAIGLKTHRLEARSFGLVPSAVTRAAKINLRHRP